MPRRKGAPEVNAGSMADIAFLLLIFFLVTTTIETDAGLDRMLPPIEPPDTDVIIKQKNIFTVNINKNGQLLVEEKLMDIQDLRAEAIAFLDNGGSPSGTPEYCNYCKGKRDASSSDNPQKAIISLKNDRETPYSTYITVQNELVAAYEDLRDQFAEREYGRSYREMDPEEDEEIIKEIKTAYPQKISEAEPLNIGG